MMDQVQRRRRARQRIIGRNLHLVVGATAILGWLCDVAADHAFIPPVSPLSVPVRQSLAHQPQGAVLQFNSNPALPRLRDHSDSALPLAAGGGGGGNVFWDGGGGGGGGGLPDRVDLGLYWDGSAPSRPAPCKVFITGATGCVGRRLVASLLLSSPHELICVVRDPARLQLPLSCRAAARKRLKLVVGDLTDKSSYAAAAATADKAILLACSWGGDDCFKVNVEATADIVAALKPSAQIIYFSSAAAIAPSGAIKKGIPSSSLSPSARSYLHTKAASLRFLLSTPLLQPRLTVLYPSLVLSPGRSSLAALVQDSLLPALLALPALSPALHAIRAADAASVTLLLLDNPSIGRRVERLAYRPRLLAGSKTAVMVPVSGGGAKPDTARHLVLGNPAWTSGWLRGLGALFGGSLGAFLGVAGAPAEAALAAWSARVWAGMGVVVGGWGCVAIPAAMVNSLLLVGGEAWARGVPTAHFETAVSPETFRALQGESG